VISYLVFSDSPALWFSGNIMNQEGSFSLREIYFRRRLTILFLSLLALILVTPLFEDFTGIQMVWNIFLTGILLSGVHAVGEKKEEALRQVRSSACPTSCTS